VRNCFDVIVTQSSHRGLHKCRLSRLAGSVGECLELALDIHHVLPRKPGPRGVPLSKGAMAINAGREELMAVLVRKPIVCIIAA